MYRGAVAGRRWAVLAAIVGVFVALGVLAPTAGAVLVKVGHRQVAGVTPIRGVNPAAIPGSYAKHSSTAAKPFSLNGNLDYHNGPVLHATAPYLIFWDPSNQITGAEKSLLVRYFADLATDGGKSTNVFAVDRQYTDTTGFADYSQTWTSAQAITDTQAYPTTGNCTEHHAGYTETACLYDSQLQTEVTRLISTDGLPTGTTGAPPIYFVVTPTTVNSCMPGNTHCADNYYCAYHSSYSDAGSTVLYSNIPTILAANDPKGCQADGNGGVQTPNSNATADVTIKYTSHEFSETVTDPLGNAWWDSNSGNEDGDNCNFYGPADPQGGYSPNAYLPTLGGSAGSGTLFNQLMNGNPYYTQSEWSNGNVNCQMQPAAATLSAAFSAPAGMAGVPVALDPSASSSTAGFTSTTWDFGDGSKSFSRSGPAATTHTYSTVGTYTATLTEVDTYGNLSTVSHTVTVNPVHGAPAAAFTVTPAAPKAGSPVAFDGSGSSESGGSFGSYSWNFGDGSAAGSGATLAHTYAAAGAYTVTLTATDIYGAPATTSQTVTVVGTPSALITAAATPIAGLPTALSGAGSTDNGSTMTSCSWKFGDGAVGSGATVNHTYAHSGVYTATLTVTDASGSTSTSTKFLAVKSASIASVSIKKGKKVEKLTLVVTGPGTLSVGKLKFKIKHAGTFVYKLTLTKAQQGRLSHHHSVKIKLTFKFKPTVGSSSSKTVSFKVKG
jgi:PKD repeat protein